MECLNNIIGSISQDCECIEVAHTVSDSGLYLDDIKYGVPLTAITSSNCNTITSIVESAKKRGTQHFLSLLTKSITENHIHTPSFNGVLSGTKWTSQLLTGINKGVKISPIKYRGVIGHVSKVRLYIQDGNFVFKIMRTENDGVLEEVYSSNEIATINNKGYYELEVDQDLDFYHNQRKQDYYILVEQTGNVKNVTVSCGCSRFKAWSNYAVVKGVEGADVDDMAENRTYVNGVSIDMLFSCGYDWLCNQTDYVNDEWSRVMAETLLLAQATTLGEYLLSSNNSYSTLNGEALIERLSWQNDILSENIDWLAGSLPEISNDCFECKSEFYKSSLKA